MPRYKVTFGFRLGAVGGSESYISKVGTPTEITARIAALIAARLACAQTEVRLDKMRFSLVDPLQKRRSVSYPPGTFFPLVKPDANGVGGVALTIPAHGSYAPANGAPDQSKSAILARVTFDTDRSAPHYFFAPPDAVITGDADAFAPSFVPAWAVKFAAFRNLLLTDGWAVRARRRDAGFTPTDIVTWTRLETTPSNMAVVINSVTTPSIVQGDIIQILSTRRKGTDRTSYNGKYVVSSVSAGPGTNQFSIFLRGTEAGDPESVKRLGQIQKIGYDFFPIENFEGIQATTRKRGRPFGQPRGNRRKVPSLDF